MGRQISQCEGCGNRWEDDQCSPWGLNEESLILVHNCDKCRGRCYTCTYWDQGVDLMGSCRVMSDVIDGYFFTNPSAELFTRSDFGCVLWSASRSITIGAEAAKVMGATPDMEWKEDLS